MILLQLKTVQKFQLNSFNTISQPSLHSNQWSQKWCRIMFALFRYKKNVFGLVLTRDKTITKLIYFNYMNTIAWNATTNTFADKHLRYHNMTHDLHCVFKQIIIDNLWIWAFSLLSEVSWKCLLLFWDNIHLPALLYKPWTSCLHC